MKTLDEAWAWYRAVAEGAKRLTHLAKFWDGFPWDQEHDWVEQIARDSVLRQVAANQMEKDAQLVTNELDDLAVLLLFSVFEANVRDLVEMQVRPEVDKLLHPALRSAGEDVLQAITEGSFFRVLEPFKSQVSHYLIETVNQVRRYRNWVAHGRRPLKEDEQLASVQPIEAYQRLKRFLEHLAPPPNVAEEAQAQEHPPT